jgi:hypothetical protein
MEVFAFQVKNNHLLSLVIDTFYSNMEIIPKDLISNAFDVCVASLYSSPLCFFLCSSSKMICWLVVHEKFQCKIIVGA